MERLLVPGVTEGGGWFKSSFSSNASQCVEVKFETGLVRIRDSKYRRNAVNGAADEPIISVTLDDWRDFLALLREELSAGTAVLCVDKTGDGMWSLEQVHSGTTLYYTDPEWQSFVAGVRAHEFDGQTKPLSPASAA